VLKLPNLGWKMIGIPQFPVKALWTWPYPFLPVGRVRNARPAGHKITLRFPHLYIYIYVCASTLITCAI